MYIMFESLFLNPAALTVGGAMVSSPILIHLINRMRFKRLRWAAMEFLLKSQKRNRRRLIIEQLLLLLLRCLLIFLAGVLLSRFIGCTGAFGTEPNRSGGHLFQGGQAGHHGGHRSQHQPVQHRRCDRHFAALGRAARRRLPAQGL
jgi:hypothetical protein